MRLFTSLTVIMWMINTGPVVGHEFWISPERYQVSDGENIVAHLRVGQDFRGASLAYIPTNIARFEMVNGDESLDVTARIGDRPAMNIVAPSEGLWIVVHETTEFNLVYDDWEKFGAFVKHKDLSGTLALHAERGLPQIGFSEDYRRFAKSLIGVGKGLGQDRSIGLLTEIVALANPYIDDTSSGVPVLVLLEGAPRADAQVEIFEKSSSGEVTSFTTRTNDVGQALIAVRPGHEYLIDSVTMRPIEAGDATVTPVWRSLLNIYP